MSEKKPEFTPDQEALMKQRKEEEHGAELESSTTEDDYGHREDTPRDILLGDAIDEDTKLFEAGTIERLAHELEEGEAIMEAQCSKCNWTDKKVFTVGDDERDMACIRLEESHESTGCKGVLDFNEKHSI